MRGERVLSVPKSDYESKNELVKAIRTLEGKVKKNEERYALRDALLKKYSRTKENTSWLVCVFTASMTLCDWLLEEFLIVTGWSVAARFMYLFTFMIFIPFAYLFLYYLYRSYKLKKYAWQLSILEDELRDLYESYAPAPIGYKYTTPAIISTVLEMLTDGRADTVKEAINYYLEDERNAQFLEIQEQIAKTSKQTAIATTATAFFSWRTSYWAKKTGKRKE